MAPIWFRTLDHLAKVSENGYTDLTAPRGSDQTGIAAALGITRAHVAINLRGLVRRELVRVQLLHIPGKGRRVKSYQLTMTGYRLLQELQARRIREA